MTLLLSHNLVALSWYEMFCFFFFPYILPSCIFFIIFTLFRTWMELPLQYMEYWFFMDELCSARIILWSQGIDANIYPKFEIHICSVCVYVCKVYILVDICKRVIVPLFFYWFEFGHLFLKLFVSNIWAELCRLLCFVS